MKSKLLKDTTFVQDYGTYSNEILVIVGEQNKKELFKYLKKIKAIKEFSKWVLENLDEWNKSIKDKNKGQFCYDDGVNGTVLMLRSTHDSWEYWEILMHECHHIVQHLAKRKGMFEEVEAQAYLQEFLFRSIRRKLMCIDKI